LKWHYQFTPHDEFDWDSVQVPVLADIDWQGTPRRVMLWANRNGFFYVLDRTTGKFLLGKAFVKQNWNEGFDEAGRPIKSAALNPKPMGGPYVEPGTQGGTNWYSPSFSPRTGLFYIPAWVNYSSIYVKTQQEYTEGRQYGSGSPRSPIPFGRNTQNFRKETEGYGAVRAIDPKTGEQKWEFKMNDVTEAGILTTASDVLFSGGREGYFFALDARTGKQLWKASVGGVVSSGPMTYAVNGKQYVAIAAGSSLFTFALPE